MTTNAPVLVSEIVDEVIEVFQADPELQGTPLNGNIYPDTEPGDTYPVLVVLGVIGEVTRTLNARHVWRDAEIQVTARDKGGTDKGALVLIMRRVSILLEGLRIQRNGMYIGPFTEVRERPRGPDRVNDDLYPQIVVEYECKAYRV
jgi:hypothetical protein